MLLQPSIRVYHNAVCGLREYLIHVAHHRRCYARVRVRELRLGKAARLGYVLLTPALPFLLLGLITMRVAAHGRSAGAFLACLPLLILGLCARAWGEFLGFANPDSEPLPLTR